MNPIAHRHRARSGGTVLTVLALVASACTATPGSTGATAPTGSPPGSVTATSPASPSVAVESIAPTPKPPTPTVVAAIPVEPSLKRVWDSPPNHGVRPWLSQPVVDPEGRIWAASPFDNKFFIVNKDGQLAETWGTSGTEDGQFTFENAGNGWGAIAFRSDGGFYVADSGNDRIQEFNRDRTHVRTWGTFGTDDGQLIDPLDIAVDSRNQVYVQSDIRHDVQVFAGDGTLIRRLGDRTGPYLTVTPDGTAYVIADDPIPTIRIYAPDGTWTATLDLHEVLLFATDIAVTPSGRIFVGSADNGGSTFEYQTLLELDRTGHAIHLWKTGTESISVNAAEDRLYATFGDVEPVVIRAYALPAR